MPTILNVQSSPNLATSGSRAVSSAFIEAYVANHPDTKVIDLDLVTHPPSHLGVDHLGAFFAPPESHTPGHAAAAKASDAYLAQVFAADVIVVGTPMHNFGIASTLKSWIDHIVRAGKTFKYTANGPVGLIPGKKAVIVIGSGGIYSEGPFKAFDHASTYLKDILSLLGITDFTILRAEGGALGPEAAAKAIPDGIEAAVKAAA